MSSNNEFDKNDIKNEDIKFGLGNEDSVKPHLERYLKTKLTKTEQYDTFDYENEDGSIKVELKSRRVNKNAYEDTMIGYNKVSASQKLVKKGCKIYFCFSFKDSLCIYNYKKTYEKYIRRGGRTDRGRDENEKHYYIPIRKLKNISVKEGAEFGNM